jgi:hypothetical protein
MVTFLTIVKNHFYFSSIDKAMSNTVKPIFDKSIFWDVDFSTLDYDKFCSWVIVRVFERGDVEDIRQCRYYYGDEKVTQALLNAKYINDNRLHLAAAVINQPVQNFRCYIPKQSSQKPYPY